MELFKLLFHLPNYTYRYSKMLVNMFVIFPILCMSMCILSNCLLEQTFHSTVLLQKMFLIVSIICIIVLS